ncbi:MAG: hypothetical protein KQJ78_12300 [Deltaproteobacteria bacterium]|nr:hypothetical protein [Deltaproteobacteria bacterium]
MAAVYDQASVYPPDAEDLVEFLPALDCGQCGAPGCLEFAEALLAGESEPAGCPELSPVFQARLAAILALPKEPIPLNCMMEEVPRELMVIGEPPAGSPLLITCNFQETVRILREILEKTGTPAYLLPIFTHGYSVDNAVAERWFRAVEVWKAMQENEVSDKVPEQVLILPGLAESEKNQVRQLSRWTVEVGPVSGFLLPLYLLEREE